MRLFLGLVFVAASFGQSFLNTGGLGAVSPPADARIGALGSPSALSYLNPGAVLGLSQVAFTGTFEATGVVGTDAAGSRFIGNVRPSGFHAAVPLPLGLKLRLGLDQRFDQDFDVWSESLEQTEYRHHVTGRGGIHDLRAGASWSLGRVAAVGVEYARLLGASREDWRLELPGYGYTTTDTVELDYSANALRVGSMVRLGRVDLAAYYEPGISFGARSLRRVNGIIEDSVVEHRITLPHAAAFGVAISASERLTFLAGADYRPWSSIALNDTTLPGARDAITASLGTELLIGRVPARAGYSYRQLYYATRSGEAVDEHRIHLGAGIPIPDFGSLNLCAEVGRRVTDGIAETAGRIGLSLSYHEAWSRRTRRWGY